MNENKRLKSLDAFRGVTIALMLLVNNAGDWEHVFRQLEHAEWHGCTVADMVFPFFVFIMGVAIPLGFTPQLNGNISLLDIFKKSFKRTTILFGLGILLSLIAYWSYMDHFRLMGVLQRLALTYFFLSGIILINKRSLEIALFWIFLLGYAGALIFYSHANADYILAFPKYYNFTDMIDTKILGSLNYTFNKTLELGHDPEGIIATIPTISSGLAGIFCGRIFLEKKSPMEKFWKLFAMGTTLLILGVFSQYIIPFNKNLWTSSYVIYTSGWAFFILSLFYYFIDIKNHENFFYPWIAYGCNAISIYFGASALAMITVGMKWIDSSGEIVRLKYFVYQEVLASSLSPILGDYICSALWGVSYVILFFFLADWMYRKKVFIKI